MTIGRPRILDTGYDPDTGEWAQGSPARTFLDALGTGNYVHTAAEYAGFSKDAVLNWRKRGSTAGQTPEGWLERHEIDPDELVFFDFVVAYTRATNRAEVTLVTLWSNAAREDWRAARDLLARRHPESWASKDHHVVSGPAGGPVQVEGLGDGLTDERIAELLLRNSTGAAPDDE